jgi:hypothetical protein
VRQPAVGERRPPRRGGPHRLHGGVEGAGHARGLDHRHELLGREDLEAVAVGQHEPPDPLAVVERDELADRAAGVVADERDVLEVQRGQEVAHQPGDARRRELGVSVHRRAVRAERQVRHDAARPALEQRSDLAPQGSVDEQAVDEDDRRALAGVAVVDGPLWERDLGHVVLAIV